jgi:hypothetical protein
VVASVTQALEQLVDQHRLRDPLERAREILERCPVLAHEQVLDVDQAERRVEAAVGLDKR